LRRQNELCKPSKVSEVTVRKILEMIELLLRRLRWRRSKEGAERGGGRRD
jgi:hypothetical protein